MTSTESARVRARRPAADAGSRTAQAVARPDPVVSVAIANFNGGAYLADAVRSALGQSLTDLEVIIVDDASTDDSLQRARQLAAEDPRIVVDALPVNGGPSAARNRALDLARGRWLAVLDSDDLMHPERLERLIARAEREGADIIADDLLVFEEGRPERTGRMLAGSRTHGPGRVSLADYIREASIVQRKGNLGYLKPVFRLDRWRACGLRYDPTMRIAEDSDLIMRLIRAGMSFMIDPELGYFYRRHPQSISHRVGSQTLSAMIQAEARFRAGLVDPSPAVLRSLGASRDGLAEAQAFNNLVLALKARRPDRALAIAMKHPLAAWGLTDPLFARLGRVTELFRPTTPRAAASDRLKVCFISRQRLIGSTNGSSAYLLALAESLRDAGMEPHLIQPSPSVLGRWPFLRHKPEMAVFASIQFRGVVRLGRWVISRDPNTWLGAAKAGLASALGKLRLPTRWVGAAPAPYAVAEPWTTEDQIFVARHAAGVSDRVVADYMFQTDAFPYVLNPAAPTAVVMHDLFHRRASAFTSQGLSDPVIMVGEAEELKRLRRADAVIAIQQEEADYVRTALPDHRVILAPMAANPLDHAQPGDSDKILFVGSNTAANVMGMDWFYRDIWPLVRRSVPSARLMVCGNVARSLPPPPEGVRHLGVVPDLAPLYRDAAVVISPLPIGSGLKIKLIEALAQGKAMVVTPVTLQGVETDVAPAVQVHEDPAAFADAVVAFLGDPRSRESAGEAALRVVRERFSKEACFAELIGWIGPRHRERPPGPAE